MISQELCEELHEQLLTERQRLEHEIASLSVGGPGLIDETNAVDQHPADDASELFEREKNLTVQRTLKTTLQGVNEALHKFDEGTYGRCEQCDQPIPEKRLRALPGATHCIDCQTKLEQRGRVASRR